MHGVIESGTDPDASSYGIKPISRSFQKSPKAGGVKTIYQSRKL